MAPTAFIMAAGRGERLRPLTDQTPKPLLQVRGRPLIEWHLQALARAGVRRVVINTAWLEDQFPAALGDGARWGLDIHYSKEGRDHGGALETAGGVAKAMALLGDRFWVVAGDVFLPGFDFGAGADQPAADRLAHLWMVPNAPHHPAGDFGIDEQGVLLAGAAGPRHTWASVGLFRAALFAGVTPGTKMPLRPLLDQAIARRQISGELWLGDWTDVGTAERLADLNRL